MRARKVPHSAAGIGMRPWLAAIQLSVASAAVWPEGVPDYAVPASFDCGMRRLAYEYGRQIQPRQGGFESLYYALGLNSLADCDTPLENATYPAESPPGDASELPADAIWVDPDSGRDDSEHPNAAGSALRTIQAALEKVQQNGVIVLQGGTHYLTETLQVGPQHSGVKIMAAPGETPVVSGGKRLRAVWVPTQGPRGAAGVFVANVSGQVKEVPGLHVGGKRATRARFPNLPGGIEVSPGYGAVIPQEEVVWAPPNRRFGNSTFFKDANHTRDPQHNQGWYANYQVGLHGPCSVYDPPVSYWCSESPAGGEATPFFTPSGLTVEHELPNAPYESPKDAVLHVWHPFRWENWMFEVESFQTWAGGGKFTFSTERGGNQGARGSGAAGKGGDFFIENVWEELDHPGEFFFNKDTGLLYLVYNGTGKPPDDLLVVAPQLQTLLNISGSQSNPVKDLTVEGVSFTASAITYMMPHGVPSGGDWAMERMAAVFLQGTESVTLSKCVFERLDGHAVMLSGYNRHAEISDSDFAYIGGTAIAAWGITNEMELKGYDGTDGNHPRYTLVSGNLAREVGLYEKQNSFYMQAKTAESRIINNVFFNGPRAGINLNDGFGGGDEIAGNLVFSTCRESGDHGPINSWDRQPYLTTVDTGEPSLIAKWREIHHNFLIDNYSPQENVDNDDGSYRYKTHDNFMVYGLYGLKGDFGGHTNHHNGNIYAYVGMVLLFWDAPMDDATPDHFSDNRVVFNRQSGLVTARNADGSCIYHVRDTDRVMHGGCPGFNEAWTWATTGFLTQQMLHTSDMWVITRRGKLVNHESGLCMVSNPPGDPAAAPGSVGMAPCSSAQAEEQRWSASNGTLLLEGPAHLCLEEGGGGTLRVGACVPGNARQQWSLDPVRKEQIGAVGSPDNGFDSRAQTSHCSGPGQVIMRNNQYFTESGALYECGAKIEDYQVSGQDTGSTVSITPSDDVILGWARELLWADLPATHVALAVDALIALNDAEGSHWMRGLRVSDGGVSSATIAALVAAVFAAVGAAAWRWSGKRQSPSERCEKEVLLEAAGDA